MGLSFSRKDYEFSVARLTRGAPPSREVDRDLWRAVVWLFEEASRERGTEPTMITRVTVIDRDTIDVEVEE